MYEAGHYFSGSPYLFKVHCYSRCYFLSTIGTFLADGTQFRPGTVRTPLFSFSVWSTTRRLLSASSAQNTIKAYNIRLACFNSFRKGYRLPELWPPAIQEVTMFIAFLSLRNFSFRTAISFQCKLRVFYEHFVVNMVLEGLRRTAKGKKARLPIKLELLQSILTKI
jgi:hypothetical protein